MNFELYRNNEVKSILAKVVAAQLIMALIFVGILYLQLNNIERKNREKEIALYGRIVKINPSLAGEIEEVFTKAIEESDLEYGENSINKYGYSIYNDIQSNYISANLKEVIFMFIEYSLALIFILFIIISKSYNTIFLSLKNISNIVCENFEGKYVRIPQMYEEGELSILINSINEMLKRLRSSIELLNGEKLFLKDIISDISHQLKTPLASLIMFNDYLLQDIEAPKEILADCLESSSEQLKRMEWLILNLLKMVRLEAGAINFNKEKASINHTVEKAVEAFQLLAKEKSQTINIMCDEQIMFEHDIEWTIEAISNIIKNSIEHTAENGEINIYVDSTPISVHIEIADNGEGIKKEDIGKIFERFYKGKNSVNPNSIGIGLALSKLIIESQGGDIRVESNIGEGSKFFITLIRGVI